MIESVKIVNFQSLRDVELELGSFTVIVGPSSSGKSAITRALKAVVSNSLDSDYITRGTKKSAISVKTEEATVTIERELGGSSVYKIAKASGQEQSFTKLNRSVPAEVTKALGISPGTQEVTSINFAGQFDAPYLLKEGASAVARVLGELTNVSTIFAAVREASRRAKGSSSILNLRKKDQAALLAKLPEYVDLPSQVKLLDKADLLVQQCTTTQNNIEQLRNLIAKIETAQSVLARTKVVAELPSLEPVILYKEKLDTFTHLLRTCGQARQKLVQGAQAVQQAQEKMKATESALHDLLVAEGQCPTCNQVIER